MKFIEPNDLSNDIKKQIGYPDMIDAYPDKRNSIIALFVIIGIWKFVGIVAFILSLACFRRSGTTEQHVTGLLLAILLGPFYFLYYGTSSTYCRDPSKSIFS
jgi:hypothetical protein